MNNQPPKHAVYVAWSKRAPGKFIYTVQNFSEPDSYSVLEGDEIKAAGLTSDEAKIFADNEIAEWDEEFRTFNPFKESFQDFFNANKDS